MKSANSSLNTRMMFLQFVGQQSSVEGQRLAASPKLLPLSWIRRLRQQRWPYSYLRKGRSLFVNAAEVGGTTRSQAHATHIGSYCSNEGNILFRLAYLITADEVQAEDAVIAAYDLAGQGKAPSRGWLLEWVKCATVKSAIQGRLADV